MGLSIVKRLDGKFPVEYLGKSLHDTLRDIDISVEEFVKICDKFTNKKIFKLSSSGALIKDRDGNLEKINDDNL